MQGRGFYFPEVDTFHNPVDGRRASLAVWAVMPYRLCSHRRVINSCVLLTKHKGDLSSIKIATSAFVPRSKITYRITKGSFTGTVSVMLEE